MTNESAPTRSWLPGYLAVALIWGASFLFIKVAVHEIPPTYVALGRIVFGALTALALVAIMRHKLPVGWKVWGHLTVVGMGSVALPFSLFAYGEQHISSVLAGIWNAATPLIALPAAVLIFRVEKATVRALAGTALGFVGVLVVLGVWNGVGGTALSGQLMCLGAAACYGLSFGYQKKFLAGRSESAVAIASAQLVTGALTMAVAAPLIAGAPPSPGDLSGKAILSVLALGVLGSGVAYVLSFRNLRLAGATTASTVTYLIPVVAVVLGTLVLDERLAWYQPVGALVVLAGIAISQGLFTRRRPEPVAAEPELVAATHHRSD